MSHRLLFVISNLILIFAFSPLSAQQHSSNSALDQYIEQASELSSRARANVYFSNPQSLFRGVQLSFVNVGTGNLTFLRRDIVVAGRIPLVLARVYDSSGKGSVDLGAGWTISAAESITVEGNKAHLLSENGSVINFIKISETGFQLEKDYPSDYVSLRFVDGSVLEAKLRTGFTKQFQLIGNAFCLVRVTDRNGNEARLSYTNDLLSKITNANHSISIGRNSKGRITSVQDDSNRVVEFAYDAKGRLAQAKDLGGKTWTYDYTDEDRLKEARDPLQRLNFAAFYDESGRVRRLQMPSGIIQFAFNTTAAVTTVTDRKNLVSRFFQNQDGITVRVTNPLGEETAVGLDASRNVTTLSRNGTLIERLEYDGQHRLITRHSASYSGVVDTSYKYDPGTRLLATVRPSSGAALSFAHDDTGNLTSASLADGMHKYRYSGKGDLVSLLTAQIDVALAPGQDGLIASLTESGSAANTMQFGTGGRLSEISFAGGRSARYTYAPSGLRSRLQYKDGWAVEYNYDPAGNLASTKVLDPNGKEIAGQVLTLDESYRLIKQVTFDGKITDFDYDRNGNLTSIREGKSLTRFEYDALNRLTAVITPDGQRLTHDYQAGERSIIEEYEHSQPTVVDRWDSGLTFASEAEALATRPLFGSMGPVRFAENLGTFQLQNTEGNGIVTPDTAVEEPLRKLQFITDGMPLQNRQNQFNRPFNSVFIPAEYASINCCPMCITNPARCFNCDPGGGTTAVTSMEPALEDLGSTSFQVTFTGTFSGSTPSITFDKPGITVRLGSHSTVSISATFDITNATVGNYIVTVTDTGGSDTATLTLIPFIDSIDPAMGLVGNSVNVTISGKGFGTAPTITLGGGITASNVSGSDTQITATFNIPSTAGGTQTLTVTNQGFSTQGDTFFGQIPSHLGVISDTGATQNFSCAAFGLNYNGIQRQILYDVLDQQSQPIQAQMTVSESFVAISNNCSGVANTPTPTTGAITDSTGTFPGPDLLALCSSSCLPADASGNPTGSCTLKVNQTWTANNFSVRTNALTYNCNNVTVTPQ